ncbi:MAG: hypothetical protein ABIQ16_04935, partial [Polyangiaceae bacterium]
MVRGKTGGGVFGSVVVAVAALALVACGKVTRTDGERETGPGGSGGSSGATGSGGNGDSSGATGGARAGSNGAAGTMGGSAATAGSGGNAGVANDGSAGDGSAGEGSAGEGSAGEPSVRFYWIEGSPEHLARAAASVKPASLRILTGGPYDAPAIIATSELHIGSGSEEVYTEAIVWTEATGTTGLGGLPGVTSGSFTPLSVPKAV